MGLEFSSFREMKAPPLQPKALHLRDEEINDGSQYLESSFLKVRKVLYLHYLTGTLRQPCRYCHHSYFTNEEAKNFG